MSLGYSMGDFISGANLTYRLIRALSETRGACMEYQEAISELGALQQTFLQVGYLRANDTLSQATINAAAYIVLSSVELIGEFLRKTEKYRKRLSRAGSGNVVSDSWQKMGWVLFKREELKALKDALNLRVTNIGVLLSTAQIHGNIPYSIAQFEEKNPESPSRSKAKTVKMGGPSAENFLSTADVTNQPKRSTSPSDLSTAYVEADSQRGLRSKGAYFQPAENSEPVENFLEDPAPGGYLAASSQLHNTENLPSTLDKTTQLKASSSDVPTSTVGLDSKWDVPSKAVHFQPTEGSEPVAPSLKVPAPVKNFAEASQRPSTGKFPSTPPVTTQPKISTTQFGPASSYVKVDGEWILSNKKKHSQPTDSGPPEHPFEDLETVGNLAEASQPETLNAAKYSENVTADQDCPLPETRTDFADPSFRAEAQASQKTPKVLSKSPRMPLSGDKLLFQLETILRETGNLEIDKKPIKFKDAVGRKFSFPFKLCSTWAGMEELIRQAFLHVEGLGPHVAEGHYDLIGPNGEIVLPRVWETTIQPDWSISMHMWPLPAPPKPPFPGPPPLPPGRRPISRHGGSLPRPEPVIVNLTRGPPGSRSRSTRREPAKGVLRWMAGSSNKASRPHKSKALGWMKKTNRLFKSKGKNEYSDSDSGSSYSSSSSSSIVFRSSNKKRR